MATKTHLFIAIFVSYALLMAVLVNALQSAIIIEGFEEAPETFGSNVSRDFKYLGMADGKSYYVDRISLNWTAASEFCQSYNLKLASIESANQWNFLVESLSDIYNLWYWTSARESRYPSMFVWNDTESDLNPNAVQGWNRNFEKDKNYRYCASLRVRQNQTSEMYPELCSARNYVLCQN